MSSAAASLSSRATALSSTSGSSFGVPETETVSKMRVKSGSCGPGTIAPSTEPRRESGGVGRPRAVVVECIGVELVYVGDGVWMEYLVCKLS